jgi:hypothetical protein
MRRTQILGIMSECNLRLFSKIFLLTIFIIFIIPVIVEAKTENSVSNEEFSKIIVEKNVIYQVHLNGSCTTILEISLTNPNEKPVELNEAMVFWFEFSAISLSDPHPFNGKMMWNNLTQIPYNEYEIWKKKHPECDYEDFLPPLSFMIKTEPSILVGGTPPQYRCNWSLFLNHGITQFEGNNVKFLSFQYDVKDVVFDSITGNGKWVHFQGLRTRWVTHPLFDDKSLRVRLNLPSDSYNWSEVVSVTPFPSEVVFFGRTEFLIWEYCSIEQEETDKIICHFKTYEDPLRKSLDEATEQSLRISRISLGLGVIAILLGIISVIPYIIPYMRNKWQKLLQKFKK